MVSKRTRFRRIWMMGLLALLALAMLEVPAGASRRHRHRQVRHRRAYRLAPRASRSNPGGRSLANTALRYRGVRYRWAGMTSRGMDCSGLIVRVLADHGIRAPHNSRALYGMGRPVSRSQLKSGDLLFFHTTRRGISHVGIYTGNDKFIHAATSGGRVQVDSLRDGYYCRRMVGARRLK